MSNSASRIARSKWFASWIERRRRNKALSCWIFMVAHWCAHNEHNSANQRKRISSTCNRGFFSSSLYSFCLSFSIKLSELDLVVIFVLTNHSRSFSRTRQNQLRISSTCNYISISLRARQWGMNVMTISIRTVNDSTSRNLFSMNGAAFFFSIYHMRAQTNRATKNL